MSCTKPMIKSRKPCNSSTPDVFAFMNNPLFEEHSLPPFDRILPEHIVPAVSKLLDDSRTAVSDLLCANSRYSWDNLIQPLEAIHDRLNKAWSPVSHLNSVVNSDALRDAYNACLPELSAYWTEIGQNAKLFEAYRSIAESPEYNALDRAQKKILDNGLRDFRLSGVALDPQSKKRFKEIEQQLSKISSQFSDNVLDATNAWMKPIKNKDELIGLPESAVILARQTAESNEKPGWLLTLEIPSYMAVITYADDRELRREIYEAYATRASDQGPHAGKWDNSEVMDEILALRDEKARLLGYANYCELSLATKMAKTSDEVLSFLKDLAKRSLPMARRDLEELRGFAKTEYGVNQLEAWDIAYFSEKFRQHRFDFSQEEVKKYFPISQVLPGLFAIVKRLYGLQIEEIQEFNSWHPDVKFFEIRDRQNSVRGRFYLDLYARPKKRGGAWMDECVTRKQTHGSVQIPVAYLVCNLTPPTGNDPALLRHEEVLTLFHEFGHGLHHMLTKVDYLSVSGIHGVEWDAVELPSQFMENWCWEREALELISWHYQTAEKLPDDLFEKMLNAKNFQSGMQMVRQLEFALFDFRIHGNYEPGNSAWIYDTLNEVRKQVAVLIPPAFNRFAHGFAHIFAGGYGAGYYSYKWAEVLSSDAFAQFEENGIFDPETGQSFLSNILEKGGSQDAMDLFVNFRGRKPSIEALLRHSGITATT